MGWLHQWQKRLTLKVDANTSVTLGHQRIFIVPSTTGIIYWLALVVMLLAAINYQNSLAYGLSFWLGAMSLLAMLHTWRNLAGLKIALKPAALVQAGDSANLSLQLSSTARAHYGIDVRLGASVQRVDVPEGAQADAGLVLATHQRGWLPGQRVRIETLYPLGLFRAWSWLTLEQSVLAYPAPKEGPMPCALGAVGQHGQNPARVTEGLDDYQGLRAYQSGDSVSRIHWKSFSKGQGLQSKTFAAEHFDEQCLDLAQVPGDLESRLSILCFWVLALADKPQPYALVLGDTRIGPDSGRGHTQACLEALALYGSTL